MMPIMMIIMKPKMVITQPVFKVIPPYFVQFQIQIIHTDDDYNDDDDNDEEKQKWP